jgi:hypothetical protein
MPKNAMGLHRSKEFMKANPEKSPEVHHLRVIPSADGVKVTHHASPSAPAFASHSFGKDEGPELANHIMEHSGMPMDSEAGGEHYADEGEEAEA